VIERLCRSRGLLGRVPGSRILRAACVETEMSIRVISVMFDRNASIKS
jgi:hypothetical protein